jgi:hypothetical protein
MFRENVLTRPEIADRIARTMVPISLNYERVLDSSSKESKFLAPLLRQRDQEQGVWIFYPDGRPLAGFEGFGDMAGRTRKMVEDALVAFGDVAPRTVRPQETHPQRGMGMTQDGSVCLAVYVRRWGNTLYSHGSSPVISSVRLTEDEFRALAPRELISGSEWSLPSEVAKRFCRLTSPLCYQHAPQPDWVTNVRIDAKLKSTDPNVGWIGYTGRLASVHAVGGKAISEQSVALTGEGQYDVKSKRMRSLVFVGTGKLVWSEAPDKPATFHALAEWELEPTRR